MHDALAYHSGGDDSDIAIGTIFSDEINRVPNVFFRERFSCRYIRLVKRDFDRFARLISAPAGYAYPRVPADTSLFTLSHHNNIEPIYPSTIQ